MIETILEGVAIVCVLISIRAFALQIARFLTTAWVRLYTAVAPEGEREDRREEMRSDLYEHIEASRSEGTTPEAIALQILLRALWGLEDDSRWSLPHLRVFLANRLEIWSQLIRSAEKSKMMIASLALLGLVNCGSLVAGVGDRWLDLILFNVVALVIAALVSNRHRPLARRIFNSWMGAAILGAVSVFLWVTFQHRLYENPIFTHSLFAMLPLPLAIALSEESVRKRFFGGRWGPVVKCWCAMPVIWLAAASLYMGGITTTLSVWAAIGAMILSVVAVCAIFGFGAALLWIVGIRVSATSLRLTAAIMRRLS